MCTLKPKDLPEIPEYCPVFPWIKLVRTEKHTDCSPSIDRINHAKGYVPGNVRWISYRANQLRSNSEAHELAFLLADALRLYK